MLYILKIYNLKIIFAICIEKISLINYCIFCMLQSVQKSVVAISRQHEELDVTEMGAEFGE